jgi:hypothetical protein
MTEQPKYLHKFCTSDRAIQILQNQQVYLAKPSDMNDPFEFTTRIEIPTDKKQREDIVRLFASRELKIKPEQLTEDLVLECVNNDDYFNTISLAIISELETLKNNSGMTCFCRTYNNKLLWAHYADQYKGVCLVFNNLKDNNSLLKESMPVIYTDDKIKLKMYDYFFNFDKHILDTLMVIMTKSKEWAYEQEWRCLKPSLEPLKNEERLVSFPNDGLIKIILGPKIDNEKRKQILKEINKRSFFITVQSHISLTNPEMEYKTIPKDFDYKDDYSWYDLPNAGSEPSFLNNLLSKEDIEKLKTSLKEQKE